MERLMKAIDLFVDCLENEGVELIFGIPGEETVAMMESLLDSKIRFVLGRHEQASAFMADVHGRLTGKAGVCMSTLGPGAMNLITGVANANLDRSPLVAVSAQVARERMHKETHQYIDLVKAFFPVTKWNASIREAGAIPEVVRKSFRVAQFEKPGAVHIEFPEDVAVEDVDLRPLEVRAKPRYHGDDSAIKEAAEVLRDARHPIILAGNGAIRAGAAADLRTFAEVSGIPVVNTFMSKGILPHDHELSLFTVGLQMMDYTRCGLDRADVVVAVGYDLVEYSPSRWNPAGDKRIIHIDSMTSEVHSQYEPAVELVGDIGVTLKTLGAITGFGRSDEYMARLRDTIIKEFEEEVDSDAMPIKPQRIVREIREAMAEEDILVSDVGMHKLWIARLFPTYLPNTVLISNGLAAMGFGLPGGIAAKLVRPDRNTVVATGDGGFMMNSQEIETAKRLGVPLTVVIFNNGKLGSIELRQSHFRRQIGVDFGNPDFAKYAESFGAAGYRVERADDLRTILKEVIQSRNVSIVDVPVDYKENHVLVERLGKVICPA
jgi:acetolactate synthase-1/2/3 large subunit